MFATGFFATRTFFKKPRGENLCQMAKMKSATRTDGTVTQVSLHQFYWPWIDEEVIREKHIAQEVFDNCEIVLLTQGELDAYQATLASIHDCVKTVSKRGFDDSFRWHKSTNYNDSFLLGQGFQMLTKSTLVAIDGGARRYEIVFLYWRDPSIDGSDMKLLCDYVYKYLDNRSNKRPCGDSLVTARGDKTMSGKMDVFGSWDAYGQASAGLGKGVQEVRIYNPRGRIDPFLNVVVTRHVNTLTEAEKALTPSCAALRAELASWLDPRCNHRMSPECDAFAMTTSVNYITDPHDDSGVNGVLEFIQFVNATGPLPPGHKWLFVIAGFLCELPTVLGEATIIALPARGVYHGTLPTSDTTATYQHGNYGSALITKEPICKGLHRQLMRGKATPPKYRSSFTYFEGNAERAEFTCEFCYEFEGSEEEVKAHEAICVHAPV